MRRFVAAFALVGLLASSAVAPSASAQAFPGAGLGGVGSGLGVLPGLGFGLPGASGLGGIGLGGIGSGLGVLPGLGFGLPGLGGCPQGVTLQQGVQLGLITVTVVSNVTNVTLAGQTRALAAGQSLANTTVSTVFPNVCNGVGHGQGLGGIGLGGIGSGLGALPGLGFGLPGVSGLGGVGLGGVGSGLGALPGLGFGLPGLGSLGNAGVGNLTGTTIGGRTCTPQGAFLVCQ